jgi:hypothetical protein
MLVRLTGQNARVAARTTHEGESPELGAGPGTVEWSEPRGGLPAVCARVARGGARILRGCARLNSGRWRLTLLWSRPFGCLLGGSPVGPLLYLKRAFSYIVVSNSSDLLAFLRDLWIMGE